MALSKPKLKKLPKKPAASASIRAMENYLEKHKAVVAENKKKLSDYEKNKKKIVNLKKAISGINHKKN